MIRMQKLTDDFTKANPDIKLNWVTLEENVLRQKVTTDIATKGGQFDVLTIGTYEVADLGQEGLARSARPSVDDADDLLPAIRAGLSSTASSTPRRSTARARMVMYRTDLMEKAGLKMPDEPTWDFIKRGRRQDDRQGQRRLRHLPARQGGWGENMAFLTATSNSFGARWFDEKWQPQFDYARVEEDARLLLST